MSDITRDQAKWPEISGRIDGGCHILPVRVYYEDTDFSGAVYHANYLKYCERGRSDFLRLIGIGHRELSAGASGGRSLGFVVRRLAAEYLRPAGIDDLLEVRTFFDNVTGARIELSQDVMRGAEAVFRQEVTIAMVDAAGRPVRVPEELRALIAELILVAPAMETGLPKG